MKFKSPEDVLLFLKYALPAGRVCQDGKIPQSRIDEAISLVSDGLLPKDDIQNEFKLALGMCALRAKELKKNEIDAEVIREYFLFGHNRMLKENAKENATEASQASDADSRACKVYPGIVRSVEEGYAVIDTPLREGGRYKTVFLDGVNVGDRVAVHYEFICERISEETALLMQSTDAAQKYQKTTG